MVVTTSVSTANLPDSLALRQVWETVHSNSCPYLYNFHMHTNASDGKLSPSQLVEQAIEIGLQGIAITDHHSVAGYQQAKSYRDKIQTTNPDLELFNLWTGIEITSNLHGVDVHILGYAFDPTHPALQPYIQSIGPQGQDAKAQKVIASIQEAGGLAILAHPFRYRRPAKELVPLAAQLGIDGIEAYYAYGNPDPWKPSASQTEEALELAFQNGLSITCGTDTHGLNLLQRL
ncbi:MAG: PHP domain-containing protein [Xenococcaceae cyanobacterium MO_234.B1]|nr:PHP domain-containing protein [Xenococcaceae cyanobacterium MO_234.B1]